MTDMAKIDRLIKEKHTQDLARLEYDPTSGTFSVKDLRIVDGDEKESGPLFSGRLEEMVQNLQVPVAVLSDLCKELEEIDDYPQTIEQAVPVGGQLPISDKGRESDPTEDDEPPPPALDDEEKTTCPDCEGGEDMALCGLCGGSGEIPLVDPPAGEKGTLMVNGKEGLTKEEAKEEAGW